MKKLINLFIYIIIFPFISIVSFLILFAFWDNYTGVMVVEAFITIICLIIIFYWFVYHTNKLHNMDNDNFQLNINILKENSGIIIAQFREGKWVIDIQGQTLEFDLKNYPFQKSYICSYFIRQLLYYEIREKKKPLRALFKIYPINKLRKKNLNDVIIQFHINNKVKNVYIVKTFKPLNRGFKRWITSSPYHWAGGRYSGQLLNNHIKDLDEIKYWDCSSSKIRKMRYGMSEIK